jgi:surface antigen
MAALFLALLVLLKPQSAYATYANTYPWNGAPCASSGSSLGTTTGSGYWCSGYNWGESPCPTGDGFCTSRWLLNGYYTLDQWGEGFRNCTSYTAWQANQMFGINTTNWKNGTDWNNSALSNGYTDDTSPRVGDIAQWDATTLNMYGHVAYVYAVNGSGVASYAEYNHPEDGAFTDSGTSSSRPPDHWIHLGTVTPPPPVIHKTDLAWVNPSTTSGLSDTYMLPSTGTGWGSSWTSTGWTTPSQVVAGDFTGDGKADLTWVNPSATSGKSDTYTLSSTGSGWSAAWNTSGWDTPSQVVSGNFTGSGTASGIVWVEPSTTSGQSNVYMIPSTGSGWGTSWTMQTWDTPTQVVAGDFTGDGKTDLLWVEPSSTPGQSHVYMIPSTGTGWGSAWTMQTWDTPTQVTSGNFTGSGTASGIVWVEPSTTSGLSNVYMIPSTGTGWGSAWTSTGWDTPTQITAGDYTADGKSDLLWVEPSTTSGLSNVYRLPSTGTGWGSALIGTGWSTPSQVVSGDFDGN